MALVISLDATRGSEIRKTQPCVIVSPDEMNQTINTIIVAPMTTTRRAYPTRVTGEIVLDQLRTIDKSRLVRKMGKLDSGTANAEMFAP